MAILYILSKLSLASAFTYSFATKVRAPGTLVGQLGLVVRFPRPWLWALALSVMAGELISVLALLTTDSLGFVASLVLLISFTGYLATIIRRKQAVSCACAGDSGTPVSSTHIVRNSLLLLLAAAGILLDPVGIGDNWVYYAMAFGPAVLLGVGLLHFAEIVQFFTFDVTVSQ